MKNHRFATRFAIGAVAAGFLLVTGVTTAQARVAPEIRAGYYADADEGFVGGGLNMNMARHWDFNPNFEYVFVNNGDYFTLNADVHRDMNHDSGGPAIWLGGGPALIFVDANDPVTAADRDDTDLGLNLFGGVGARTGEVRPFGQFKVTLSDESESSLAFGLRF